MAKRIVYFQLLNESRDDIGDVDRVHVTDDSIIDFRDAIKAKRDEDLVGITSANLKVFSNRSHIQDASKVCFRGLF